MDLNLRLLNAYNKRDTAIWITLLQPVADKFVDWLWTHQIEPIWEMLYEDLLHQAETHEQVGQSVSVVLWEYQSTPPSQKTPLASDDVVEVGPNRVRLWELFARSDCLTQLATRWGLDKFEVQDRCSAKDIQTETRQLRLVFRPRPSRWWMEKWSEQYMKDHERVRHVLGEDEVIQVLRT